MTYIHIIVLWVVFVFLISLCFVIKVCSKQGLVSTDIDIFTTLINKKKESLKKSDIDMSIISYFGIMFGAPLVLGISMYIISRNALLSVVVAASSLLTPEAIIMILKQKVDKEYEERYARSLEQLSFSLKSGLSIIQAVQEVANNKFIHESIRERYRRLSMDLQMGISISEGFKRFADSTTSKDAKDVALAIDIQNEVGGHEADIIMSIAKDIHDRIMLRREIKSIFSGTSSMVYIMDVLPLGVILYLCLTDPTYIDYYFKSTANVVLFGFLIGLCILGSIMNHIKLGKILKGV